MYPTKISSLLRRLKREESQEESKKINDLEIESKSSTESNVTE